MADIEIRMLGKFEILMDGKPVLAALKQSRKSISNQQLHSFY